MKKIIFIGLLSMCASVIFAQLKVTSDGKVGIGLSSTPISRLAVGHVGDPTYPNYFYSNNNTMCVWSTGSSSNLGNLTIALRTIMEANSSRIYVGLHTEARKNSPSNSGRSIGILAAAGNATYNQAVIGMLGGSNNGAGIFGTVNDSHGGGISMDGRYAGYFYGNVKVTGTINGTVIGPSDYRFKQNVTELGSSHRGDRNVLNAITSLTPISYNLKQVYHELPPSDTIQAPQGMFDEKSPVFRKNHFGLIAQDLRKIYPDLVYENDNGYLSINYTEIIPLLIQSIKELKEEVDLLSAALVGTRSATANDIIAETPRAVLYQNTPNPFSARTEIKFELPVNSNNAFIYIFNMQGSLVRQIAIGSMQQSVIINGSELTAGMYMYSLIVEGKEIDTKRMILTK